jgi:hypothetical protein
MNSPRDVLKTIVGWFSELSPSCKAASRLQSAALDRKLSPVQRLGLRIHVLFCKWCRAYGKQIKFLRLVAKEHASVDGKHSHQHGLSPEARERIKRKLRSEKD